DGLTEAAFDARDLREEGWGVLDAIEASDIVIQNEGDLDAFSKEVYQVLMEMITDE
ncbi:dephospho-CoA kinase, partial [Methanosarcinales archaeon]